MKRADDESSGQSRMMRKSHVRFPEKGVATYWSFDRPPLVNSALGKNTHFKAFQDDGIEPELEYKMERMSRVSVAQANIECKEVWNDSSSIPSSPNFNEQEVERRESKRASKDDVSGSNKSFKVESSRRVEGPTILLDKLDAMVQVVTESIIKDMELMNVKARSLVESSH
ncbi:hypothetical protein V6N13_125462 [Hibiscus sabdariffa]